VNRLSIDIRDDILQYSGSAVLIRGRVANSGLVQVSVSRDNLRASGSGRLSGNSGTGTWRGSNSAAFCTGMSLSKAFMQLPNAKLRRSVVELVEQMAAVEKTDA
jgi:hypothetical protein